MPNKFKEWETVGKAKIIIMSWYKIWYEISACKEGTIAKISISYLPPNEWYYKILSLFFAGWYCNWCLNTILRDTRRDLEKTLTT